METAIIVRRVIRKCHGDTSKRDTNEEFENAFVYFDKGPWMMGLFNFARIVIGIGVLIASTIIIVQSESIIDLFANFAALTFIGNLDNLVFMACIYGFAGNELKLLASEVEEMKLSLPSGRNQTISKVVCGFFLLIVTVPWIFLYFAVLHEQTIGTHCRDLFLENDGDAYGLSGKWEFWGEYANRRPVYHQMHSVNRAVDAVLPCGLWPP
mmetsp:Transcript_26957/g.42110  ORF Transcript_26957/g.42110 Transcript_26957/m.42110 type:complete len:210 (+) Transcript_26957:1-630(+)